MDDSYLFNACAKIRLVLALCGFYWMILSVGFFREFSFLSIL